MQGTPVQEISTVEAQVSPTFSESPQLSNPESQKHLKPRQPIYALYKPLYKSFVYQPSIYMCIYIYIHINITIYIYIYVYVYI